MTSQNNKEEELRRREQELQQRELAIRLRELESEIEPPVMPTVKHDCSESAMQQKIRNLLKTAKFIGLVAGAGIVFVIVWRVGTFLATFVIVGLVAWVLYKLFLQNDRPKRG